jgi:hypothetical protein
MKKIKITLLVITVLTVIVALEYIDYTMYKAKYPNTTVWMWMIDNNK